MKHSKGPWSYKTDNHGRGRVYSADGAWVATAWLWAENDTDIHCPSKDNARLMAAAPELLEALIVSHECGSPIAVSLYDEEGIEGWRWTHPDGREWEEIGDWGDPMPMHPLAAAAILKATGKEPE